MRSSNPHKVPSVHVLVHYALCPITYFQITATDVTKIDYNLYNQIFQKRVAV